MANPNQEALLWRRVIKLYDQGSQGDWMSRKVLIQPLDPGRVSAYDLKAEHFLSTSLWDSGPGGISLHLRDLPEGRFTLQTATGSQIGLRGLVDWNGVYLTELPKLIEKMCAERDALQSARKWQQMGEVAGQLEVLLRHVDTASGPHI